MELRGNLHLENRVVDDTQSDDKIEGNDRKRASVGEEKYGRCGVM